MKKLFLAFALLMTVTSVTVAQTNDRAIGIRGLNNAAEISFQNPLSNSTRLELDLGLYGFGDHMASTGMWVLVGN